MSLAGAARAQNDPAVEVVQLNQKAMADYQNMKIGDAVATLQEAEGICLQFSLQGHEMALTYVNMGVIEAAGNQNEPAAIDFFTRALCLEPTILVDPLVSTPEVETVFNMAREQSADPSVCAQLAAGAIPPPPPPPPGGDFLPPEGLPPGGGFDEPIPPPPPGAYGGGPPPPQTENIRHEGVPQQEKMVPLPLFTMVKPGTDVGQVMLYYRTFGERNYQQMEMASMEGGYGATIGCDVLQTFDPTAIEYYISILSPDGQIVGSAGNEMQPFTTTIVSSLAGAPAPSLPNTPPPSKCVAECPPWNPECNKEGNCKQFGDVCTSDADCCKGMACEDQMCTPSDESGGGGDFKPKFRMTAAFGTGGGYVPSESAKPYNRVAEPPFDAWFPVNETYCRGQGYSSSEDKKCYDDVTKGIDINGGIAWSKLQFRATPMFYFTDKWMLGASFRGGLALDPSSEVMKVAPLGLLIGGYRILGSGTDKYEMTAILGVGGGFILHKVSYKDCNPYLVTEGHPWYPHDEDGLGCHVNDIDSFSEWKGPAEDDAGVPNWYEASFFRKAGFVAIELGLEQYFWVHRNFGVHFGLIFDALVPNFAINGDVQLGVAFRL